jgi:hypothetical protein
VASTTRSPASERSPAAPLARHVGLPPADLVVLPDVPLVRDGTVVFTLAPEATGGSLKTIGFATKLGKPSIHIARTNA